VATTLAMWLFLLRSAMEMASSSLPSRHAPATCCTKTRDCFASRAVHQARASIMTPRDHAKKKEDPTTAFAIILILLHIVLRSLPCRTIRLLQQPIDSQACHSLFLFRSRLYKPGTTIRCPRPIPD